MAAITADTSQTPVPLQVVESEIPGASGETREAIQNVIKALSSSSNFLLISQTCLLLAKLPREELERIADIADGALWDYQSAKYPEALERLADETQQYIAAGQVYPIDPK